jgi:hypothetical protein
MTFASYLDSHRFVVADCQQVDAAEQVMLALRKSVVVLDCRN